MDTCFLCDHVLVPCVPPSCRNAALRSAYEGILYSNAHNQPVNVAEYDIKLFNPEKICLIKEKYNPDKPNISLTNSIEIAIVQVCSKYGLCPSIWTFAAYANYGFGKHCYQEYDMIILNNNTVKWNYLWHSDCRTETESYSDTLLIQRINQYRSGSNRVL